MNEKGRLSSKTHWAGGLITVLGVICQNEAALVPLLGEWGGIVIAACGGLMMVLRELTNKPVKGL